MLSRLSQSSSDLQLGKFAHYPITCSAKKRAVRDLIKFEANHLLKGHPDLQR
jgi:hypothetical protein